jgi:hypothetical protein
MATTAAKNTTVKLGGTPTAFTNEAATRVTANTVYQLTDATKRALDPATAVVVEVDAAGGGSWVEAVGTTYALDYCNGKVTFADDQGGSALVRFASGKFIPLLAVAEAHSAEISGGPEAVEAGRFGDEAKRMIVGGSSLSVSLEVRDDGQTDLDSGAGTTSLFSLIGQLVFIEMTIGTSVLRAWGALKASKVGSKRGEAVNSAVEFEGSVQTCTGRPTTDQAMWSWT